MRKLFGDAVRYFPLLAARVDEQQIFLPVVEEAEIALRVAARLSRGRWRRARLTGGGLRCKWLQRRSGGRSRFAGSFNHDWTWPLWRMSSHEAMDAIKCVGCDTAAVAQPRGKFAVIHGPASKRGLCEARLPAIVRDFLE